MPTAARAIRLHLVRSTRRGFDAPWQREAQPAGTRISDNAANLAAVREGMIATVHGPTGTARAIGLNSPYLIGGKTGTAQVVSNKNNLRLDPHSLPLHLRHQALFIGFAPADNPRIAVAVVVEHGGFGSSSAAPIAKRDHGCLAAAAVAATRRCRMPSACAAALRPRPRHRRRQAAPLVVPVVAAPHAPQPRRAHRRNAAADRRRRSRNRAPSRSRPCARSRTP